MLKDLGSALSIHQTVAFADVANQSRTIRILAISGSLLQSSSNTALLQAAIALSPQAIEMNLYGGFGDLRVVPEACMTVSLLDKNLDAAGF